MLTSLGWITSHLEYEVEVTNRMWLFIVFLPTAEHRNMSHSCSTMARECLRITSFLGEEHVERPFCWLNIVSTFLEAKNRFMTNMIQQIKLPCSRNQSNISNPVLVISTSSLETVELRVERKHATSKSTGSAFRCLGSLRYRSGCNEVPDILPI
jgi:hypothetical protein